MIDVQAGEPQFIDHLAPVYLALPPEHRGEFVIVRGGSSQLTPPQLVARAASRGVSAVIQTRTLTDRRDVPVLVASWGDQKRATKAGRRYIARMEHGIGQSFVDSDHVSYAGGPGADIVRLFLTPNEHSARRWKAAYPDTPVEVIGCPKLEYLPKREPGPGPTVAVSFHWGRATHARGVLAETYGSFHEYRDAIWDLSKRFHVLGHGHPRVMREVAPHYRLFGVETVRDFTDICRRADLYVCDTNSTIYEFASTGRPVVVVNGKHFRRDVEHGLRFWEASGVGINCDRPADLIETVERALVEDHTAEREAALDIVYAYRSGAAERAAAALVRTFSHLDNRVSTG